jgi:flagellar FliL protein
VSPGKKKLIFLIGGLASVLIALPLILMVVLGGERAPEPVVHEPVRIVVPDLFQPEERLPGPTFLYRLGGFLIEQRGSEGEVRFLRSSFAIPMDNPALFIELGAKELVVRNAIYYYLSNRPLTFLADRASREALKSDLLAVINDLLSADEVHELLFEEYLVTGP